MSDAANSFDVAIVGGGLVGLVLAALLKESRLRIAVIEGRPPQPRSPNADLDLRMSALAPASRAILEQVGIWQQLQGAALNPYANMCVWQAQGTAQSARSINFQAAELGEQYLGYIVENESLRLQLWQLLHGSDAVEFITAAQPEGLAQTDDAVCIHFADDTPVSARLLIGADGARSWVRSQLGIAWHERGYGATGLVAHVASEKPHADTAWQRFLPDGPVALLPLADGRSSLVWSCPDDRAQALLALSAEDFGVELTAALDGILGQMRLTSELAGFPLAMGYVRQYTGPRYALVGDAAHRVHPLAGQGVNLGLLDAATLAENLLQHMQNKYADPGDMRALRRYERARKGDNLLTMGTMDALQKVFASPLAGVAGAGLEFVDALQPVKARLAAYAMGRGRNLPAAARLAS